MIFEQMEHTIPSVITIETDRMLLKEVTPEFYDYIFDHWTDDEIMRYLGFFEMANYLVEKQKNAQKLVNYNISFKNFIMEEKATGNIIGRLGFHTWYVHHNRAEIGYGILKEEDKNKGFMREALKPLLVHGFEQMKLNRIEALLAMWNTPSLKLIERYGFTYEGNLRGHYFTNGKHEDSACFSLLRSEYDSLKHNW